MRASGSRRASLMAVATHDAAADDEEVLLGHDAGECECGPAGKPAEPGGNGAGKPGSVLPDELRS